MKGETQETGTETNEEPSQLRSWTDLPSEILSSIAQRLTIIELLSFRRTCKDFHSASPGIGSCRGPWLLFQKTDSSECQFYNQNGSKIFRQKFPDLEGAICLASYQGWLLVSKQEKIFFFYPFSLAKITLPDFPHQQMDDHVAAFSDVPTSPHCIVSVFHRNNDTSLVVNMISKGQSAWTRHILSRGPLFFPLESTFTAATFDRESQSFCYIDHEDFVHLFSVEYKVWKVYVITEDEKWIPALLVDDHIWPCYYTKHVFHDMIKEKRHQFDLEDEEYVSVCGLTYKDDKARQVVYQNEVVDVSPTKKLMRRAVWIQPRFYEADLNLHW